MGGVEFLRGALRQLVDPRWLGPAILFFLFLGGTNAALALLKPAAGAKPGALFALMALVRVVALVSISVAALREAADTTRKPWRPDAGFWLCFLLLLATLVALPIGFLVSRGVPGDPGIALRELVSEVLLVPLGPWIVAAAVERPAAWSPMPWLKRFGVWSLPLLLWSLILLVPLATAHAFLSLGMIDTAWRRGFWPAALADALVTTLLVLLGLALRLAAYRRVARS
jgi:hypothetical protein